AARAARDDTQRTVDESLRRLGAHAARLTLDEGALEAALHAARQHAARCDELLERITTTRRDVEQAIAGTRLTDALAAETAARGRLLARLDEATFAAAGAALLDEVEREHEAQARPALLAEAASWFGAFTRHAWALDAGAGAGAAPGGPD